MTLNCTVQDFPYADFSGTCSAPANVTSRLTYPPGVDSNGFKTTLDAIQLVLDGVGLIPGFGEAADALNALISGLRGDYIGAALSVICMVPVAGYVGNALKAGRHLSPNGMIKVVRGLGEPALRAIARSMDDLVDFLSALPGKLKSILDRLRKWPAAISADTHLTLTRALEPVFEGIDRAFAEIVGMLDEALHPPNSLAMAGAGGGTGTRAVGNMNMSASTPSRPRSTGGGGSGGGGGVVFRQGDHLVNTGLRKVLDELELPQGQGAALIKKAREALDAPMFREVVRGVAKAGDDLNSQAFGWAAHRTRQAAKFYREATTPGQKAARALSLRGELRDMLKAAVDAEVAGHAAMNPRTVKAAKDELIRVWAILDGAVARSAQTILH